MSSRRGSLLEWARGVGSTDTSKPLRSQSAWECKNGQWVLTYEDGEEVNVMYLKEEKVPMRDFAAEIRPSLDVAHFLSQGAVLLDLSDSTLEAVVDAVLVKLKVTAEEPLFELAQVKSSLFSPDSRHLLARTIQVMTTGSDGTSADYDQSWLCAISNLPTLQKRHVAIARLKRPTNFGRTSQELRFFILVLCPTKEKGTKSALEAGRTFATIFADMETRQRLLEVTSEDEFKRLIMAQAQNLSQLQSAQRTLPEKPEEDCGGKSREEKSRCRFGNGILDDLRRRLPHYWSDYRDGIVGPRTVQKTVATTFFLYFACILPAIAFGVLNDHTTGGRIDVKKTILGQAIGQLIFSVLGGQPLNVLLTTAPLCLFVKIVNDVAADFQVDFDALYFCVGLSSALFTALFAVLDVSRIMKWSTRSSEEIFSLFITIAFIVDAGRDTFRNFHEHYETPACRRGDNTSVTVVNLEGEGLNGSRGLEYVGGILNVSGLEVGNLLLQSNCHRDSSLLFLLLMLGTVWLGVSLYKFNRTPYLEAGKREALADYSLPVAVVVMSCVGSFVFQAVPLERFKYDDSSHVFQVAALSSVNWSAVLVSFGLGGCLSLLILMDQNISSALVNNPSNRLKKGPAYHWDLLIVALLNGFMSVFTLPWMHAALPHCPLHMRSLADVEERVDQGHVQETIVRVRETRLTGIFSHVLIGLSVLLLPYPLGYIPTAVLNGLFLYMAITALTGNQMFERISLLVTEQAAYPPNHYVRKVPQRKIHAFTGVQLLQLGVMCFVGFAPWPYVKMMFPITLLLLLPIRHKIVPRIVDVKYLEALDGHH